MTRRPNSIFEDIAHITSKLPWWAGVFLAIASFLSLHWYAGRELSIVAGADGLYEDVLPSFLSSLAVFGQLVAPAAFLLGALFSVILNFRRKKLYDRTCRSASQNPLGSMSWRDFEYLVGEYFKRRQFSVNKATSGADGGVDLIACKSGEKRLIQCKHWQADKVGVKAARELLGVMDETGATGGIIVTSGEFTEDVVAFARANHIALLNGRELLNNMKSNVEFLDQPGKKPTKMHWVLAFLLVIITCCSVLLFTKTGMSLRTTLAAHLKEFLSDSQERLDTKSTNSNTLINKNGSTDHTFTQEQIRRAMEEVLAEKKSQQNKDKKNSEQEGTKLTYLYEIELITGGWIYTDNAEITGDKVTYKNSNGIIVSINIDQIKTLTQNSHQ